MSTRMKLTKILGKLGTWNKPKPKLRQIAEKKRWNIVRGDKVQVIGQHAEKGKQGIVTHVLRKLDRVIVQGVNLREKRIKGNPEKNIQAKTIQQERSLPYSQVSLVDPVSGKPTRIVRQFLEDGSKVRVSKKSGAVIPRPELLLHRKTARSSYVCDVSDTKDDAAVWEVTYNPPT